MQLFVTEYEKKGSTVNIKNPDILSQIRKVLRAKLGDVIRVQSPIYEATMTRYEVRMDQWNDKEIIGTILSEQTHESSPGQTNMIVAMPNKRDKAEMIVQKLSEVGVTNIIFRPTERSVIKEWNPKKEERLYKIVREAVEQSRGRRVPGLRFSTDISKEIQDKDVIIFDKQEQGLPQMNIKKSSKDIVGIIGPEGGLTSNDYQQFASQSHQIVGLGDTVLRMETAAIIGARLLKNNDKG